MLNRKKNNIPFIYDKMPSQVLELTLELGLNLYLGMLKLYFLTIEVKHLNQNEERLRY